MIIGRAVRKRSLRLWRGISVSSGTETEVDGKKRFAALWGNGDYGRLGHGSLESRWTPNPLLSSAFHNQSPRQIACGGAHTLFLTENGCVYASGLNDHGQLGVSDDRAYITEPLGVAGLPKEIVKVSAGYHHSSAITGLAFEEDGAVTVLAYEIFSGIASVIDVPLLQGPYPSHYAPKEALSVAPSAGARSGCALIVTIEKIRKEGERRNFRREKKYSRSLAAYNKRLFFT